MHLLHSPNWACSSLSHTEHAAELPVEVKAPDRRGACTHACTNASRVGCGGYQAARLWAAHEGQATGERKLQAAREPDKHRCKGPGITIYKGLYW